MKNYKQAYLNEREIVKKNDRLLKMMCKWMDLVSDGYCIKEYFQKHGYKNIAIYGFNLIGRCLYKSLSSPQCGLNVKYCIDINANKMFEELRVYLPEDELPSVDVIVVTPIQAFYDIERLLVRGGVKYPIISLDEIIYSIANQNDC